MTQEQKEELKNIIQTEIESLKKEIEVIQPLLKPIKKDCSLDTIDQKMLEQQQNIEIKRYKSAKTRLDKLQATYIDIESAGYGVCQECDEDINLERLKIIPESKYCVRCLNELGL